MAVSRRSLLRGGAAALGGALLPMRALTEEDRVFTPEMFGARGDGVTNDTAAMARLSSAVTANGGGIVHFRKTVYLVGEQIPALHRGGGYSFTGRPILEFVGCRGPLTIRGDGARLKCAPGLRYGTFDAETGEPTHHKMPFVGGDAASPYPFMIRIEKCNGPIEVSEIELDGNLPQLRIGGEYGDTGRQIPASGLGLLNNRGSEAVRDVYTHHHGQDGLYIDGLEEVVTPSVTRIVSHLRSTYNGRQGCSIVGGRGYHFDNCDFSRTGRSSIASAPGAGVDIEAEGGKRNRDFSFSDCRFIDNVGVGMVADSGDSEGARFLRCTFVGTTAWSAWPFKPRFRFDRCTFVGTMVRCFPSPNPEKAAQFYDCNFLDDPSLSPTGKVCTGGEPEHAIVDMGTSKNVQFVRCRFHLIRNGLLPWSWEAVYRDCRMDQKSPTLAYPKGLYFGTNSIVGNVNLYGTTLKGTLVLNGKVFHDHRW
jgi:hypothetical protein